jgi:molybdopterin/thiamine biosynthesis adenylyltransferase
VSLPPLVAPDAELSVEEVRRYSRHLIIPDVGNDGTEAAQERQGARASALAVSARPRCSTWPPQAWARWALSEFDEVDESNLQRQVIHGQSDIGKSKAVSAQGVASSRSTRSSTSVLHEGRLENDNVKQVFEGSMT